MQKFWLFFVLLGSFALFSFIGTQRAQASSPPTDAFLCMDQGGTWESFPHACGDPCIPANINPPYCPADNPTYACNCGPTKCWNGPLMGCVANTTFKPTIPPVCGETDRNKDGITNSLDVQLIIAFFWETPNATDQQDTIVLADVNCDNNIDLLDYSQIVAQLGTQASPLP